MNLLIGLIRIALLGIILFGLISIGLVFFAVVSIMLMTMGGIVWLKRKDVLYDPDAVPKAAPTVSAIPEEVIVERKIIDANYEELG